MLGNNRFLLILTLFTGLLLPEVVAKPLTVITYQEAPFAEQAANGNQGLVIELLAELFARAEIEYHVVFFPLKRGMALAEQHTDYCVLPIERNQQRESRYRWIGPVMISRYGLYSHQPLKDPLITLEDARKYSIGSFLGSGIGEYLISLGFKVELTSNAALNVKKLQRNRIDLWASELISANWLMKQQRQDLGEPLLVFYTSLRAMACHNSMPDKQYHALTGALQSMYQDGFMKQLHDKYSTFLERSL
ncbi:substrate-binding periplasmic protein [Shewanella maritima]|uniref:substrate-binding periplasmic protein n=1 Tax=Shewanella maritima TaxID=2520507 RepID=UPI003736C8CE